MYPRPKARGKPPEMPDMAALAEELEHIRFVYGEPSALATGLREWQLVKRTPEGREHLQFWPGGEETFHGVPVVVRRHLGAPRILRTQDDMDEVLLEAPNGR